MMKGSNNVALGYDEGSIIVKVKYGATDLYMSYWDKGLLSDRVVCMGKYSICLRFSYRPTVATKKNLYHCLIIVPSCLLAAGA